MGLGDYQPGVLHASLFLVIQCNWKHEIVFILLRNISALCSV